MTAGGQGQPGARVLSGGSCRITGEPEEVQIYCSSFLSSESLGVPDLNLWGPLGLIQSCLQMQDGSTEAQSWEESYLSLRASWGENPGQGGPSPPWSRQRWSTLVGRGPLGVTCSGHRQTVLSGPGKTRAFRMVQYWGLRLKRVLLSSRGWGAAGGPGLSLIQDHEPPEPPVLGGPLPALLLSKKLPKSQRNTIIILTTGGDSNGHSLSSTSSVPSIISLGPHDNPGGGCVIAPSYR